MAAVVQDRPGRVEWARRNPTDFCVLGLLLIRDMTIYELRQAFSRSLALFYSASLGSLQVAVRKLLAAGLVSVRELREGRRLKKVYRIEPAGTEAFFSGMTAEIPLSRLEVTALARLHFLGLLKSTRERKEVLFLIVAAIETALAGLEELKGRLSGLSVPAAERAVFAYQQKTLEYGIMAHRAGLAWFRELLEEHSSAEH